MSGYAASEVLGAIRRERFPGLVEAARSGVPLRAPLRAMLSDVAGELGGRLSSSLETVLLGIAERAERLLLAELRFDAMREEREGSAFMEIVGLADREWRTRSEASSRSVDRSAMIRPAVLGDAGPGGVSDRRGGRKMLDGRIVAEALAVAIREGLDRSADRIRKEFKERGALRRSGEREAEARWRVSSRKVESLFFSNARSVGMDRKSAVAAALVAGCFLRISSDGHGGDDRLTTILGATAALATPRRDPVRAPVPASAWRSAWQTPAGAEARSVGSEAIAAAFGAILQEEGTDHHAVAALGLPDDLAAGESEVRLLVDGLIVMRLPWSTVAPLLSLSLRSAVARLEAWASDPRLETTHREKCRRMAEAAKGASLWRRNDRTPFGPVIGIDRWRIEATDPTDGSQVYEAVPVSRRFPAMVACRGAYGRTLTCRALADDKGRLVGYWAYDAWSREMRGKALRAFYRLDGRRDGTVEPSRGSMRLRLNDRSAEFVTAPEHLTELTFAV